MYGAYRGVGVSANVDVDVVFGRVSRLMPSEEIDILLGTVCRRALELM
jgi:hypothetical protein